MTKPEAEKIRRCCAELCFNFHVTLRMLNAMAKQGMNECAYVYCMGDLFACIEPTAAARQQTRERTVTCISSLLAVHFLPSTSYYQVGLDQSKIPNAKCNF